MTWQVVRIAARCAYGCQIAKGELAVFGRRRFVLCTKHAKGYKMTPPRGAKKRDEEQTRQDANARDPKLRQLSAEDR